MDLSSSKWLFSLVLLSSCSFLDERTIDPGELPTTVEISSGKYLMGTPESEVGRRKDEGPQRWVEIRESFYVGVTEVTRAQFSYFVQDTGYRAVDKCLTNEDGWDLVEGRNWENPGFDQHDKEPVVCVNWQDALAYVQWLSSITEDEWRLPSGAEWEYVARARTKGRFSNSGTDEDLCEIAYAANSTICPANHGWLAPVSQFGPNQFGLYDVHGNVWEWTADCYHSSYEGAPTDGSAWTTDCESVRSQGRILEDLRVIRGGSTFSPPSFVRSGVRSWSEERMGHINLGFRVVREIGK